MSRLQEPSPAVGWLTWISDPKMAAFLGFLLIRVSLGIVYKFSATQGKYSFSPNSAITIAEFLKLLMSGAALWKVGLPKHKDIMDNKNVAIPYIFLALVYCVNNQITFYFLARGDPASLELFKSMSPFFVVMLLWVFTEEQVSRLQWVCIVMQSGGLILMTIDSCKSSAKLPLELYAVVSVSLVLTSVSSIVNMKLIKGCSLTLPAQNSYLYAWGVLFNLFAFMVFPANEIGFFEGYTGSIWPVLVLCCNAFIGIAITAVYRYADVVVKTFASAAALAVLVYLSSVLFGQTLTLPVVVSTLFIAISSWLYFVVAPRLSKLEEEAGTAPPYKPGFATRVVLLFGLTLTLVSAVSYATAS